MGCKKCKEKNVFLMNMSKEHDLFKNKKLIIIMFFLFIFSIIGVISVLKLIF